MKILKYILTVGFLTVLPKHLIEEEFKMEDLQPGKNLVHYDVQGDGDFGWPVKPSIIS